MSALPARRSDSTSSAPLHVPDRFDETRPALRVIHPDELVDDPQLPPAKTRRQTDERLNFITHGLGFLGSIGAALVLWQAIPPQNLSVSVAVMIYAFSMMGVYSGSMMSHGQFPSKWHHRFRTWDQVAIFLFMAGTATPFFVTFLPNMSGMLLLGATWTLALVGIGAKLFVTKRSEVHVGYYIAVALFPCLSLLRIGTTLDPAGLSLLGLSAVSLVIGLWFFLLDYRATWYHSIWHLMVIVGSICQFLTVLWFVVPAAM